MPARKRARRKIIRRRTDPVTSHVRGLPPLDTLPDSTTKAIAALADDDDYEMAVVAQLMTTLNAVTAIQQAQPRGVGRRLDSAALLRALTFLHDQTIPLRSGATSLAARAYGDEVARTEAHLRNPAATANSRLARLVDLRRKLGIPDPPAGRPMKSRGGASS
jgi:hypothetical protein